MDSKKILGVVERPVIPGAPAVGDAYTRHLIGALEGQRDAALSACAQVIAEYELLSAQYQAHVKRMNIELSTANENLRLAHQENARLRQSASPISDGTK